MIDGHSEAHCLRVLVGSGFEAVWASSLHLSNEILARGGLEHTASDPNARAGTIRHDRKPYLQEEQDAE